MITEATYYCETCFDNFKDSARCEAHEANCEKYAVGDRVEVFYQDNWISQGKWWSGTISRISLEFPKKRFVEVRTDEQFAKADLPLYTGYDWGIWEDSGDKKHLRRLVDQEGTKQ
ncbi:MAG: hypothetical protein HYW79_00215 [Parcubacteria group bacterium]|nr:hypothetical protein [Parcubacteria group bacterium]